GTITGTVVPPSAVASFATPTSHGGPTGRCGSSARRRRRGSPSSNSRMSPSSISPAVFAKTKSANAMPKATSRTTASWRVSQRTASRSAFAEAPSIGCQSPPARGSLATATLHIVLRIARCRPPPKAVVRFGRGEHAMTQARVQIGIVGDFDPANRTHRFTNEALEHVGLRFEWVPTDALGDSDERLGAYDGIWIAPASPYRSMDGALAAIRYARERGVPLVGT